MERAGGIIGKGIVASLVGHSKVVITGAGIISSVGAGLPEFEAALYRGASGIGPSVLIGDGAVTAEVPNFVPQQWLGNKGIRVLDRTARLLSVAAQMALSSIGLETAQQGDCDPDIGLVCGTMFGSIRSITAFDWSGLEDGPNLVNPMDFPNTVINSAAGQAAIKFKLGGINSTLCGGLAAGLYALDYAAEFLKLGRARLLLAGGVEELSEETFLGFRKNNLMSAAGRPLPFHKERDGVVLGEGAALLVLEREEGAAEHGRRGWAEISGFGCAQDAHSSFSYSLKAEGATTAMQSALEEAGITPEQVGCIVASASGSPAGDAMEARALQKVFGNRLAEIPICAPKAALGESLGLGGAAAVLIAALALDKRCLPPTANVVNDNILAGLRLSNHAQPVQGDFALVNAFSCDGNNASMVLRRSSGVSPLFREVENNARMGRRVPGTPTGGTQQ